MALRNTRGGRPRPASEVYSAEYRTEEHPRQAVKTDSAKYLAAVPEVDLLLRWMERATDGRIGDAEWAFGGGSALAAHWSHRRSADLDVFVPYGAYLDWIAHGGPEALLERLVGTYAHAKASRVDAAGDAAVKFSGLALHGNAMGAIDVIGINPMCGALEGPYRTGKTARPVMPISTILAGKLLGRGPMALPRDVYDLAVAVKRAPHDAKAAIERTPFPVLATCLSRWEDMPWSEAGTGGRILHPTDGDALRRAPEIVVNAVEEWIPGSTAQPDGTAARRPPR